MTVVFPLPLGAMKKSVIVYNSKNEMLAYYDSMLEASIATGVERRNIRKLARNYPKMHHKWFIMFQFQEDVRYANEEWLPHPTLPCVCSSQYRVSTRPGQTMIGTRVINEYGIEQRRVMVNKQYYWVHDLIRQTFYKYT